MMKKVVILRRRTDDPFSPVQTIAWDASTKALRWRALVELFRHVEGSVLPLRATDAVISSLAGMATAGNPDACEAIVAYLRNRGLLDVEEVELR